MLILQRLRPALLVVIASVAVLAGTALASGGGRTGFSGNPATNLGANCTTCHATGAATPSVAISGPAVVNAGETNLYQVTITGGPGATGGFDASTSNFAGTFAPIDGDTEVMADEITHSAPKAFSGGQASFSFNWTAPANNGAVTMYAAGNSTNGQGNTSGDGVGTATLSIAVQNGTPGPTPTPVPAPSSVTLQQVASGLTKPDVVTHAGDNRLFIVEQPGRIRVVDATGALLSTPYLNITSRVDSTHNEQGLLGLAFHPNYASNGYFYVYYTIDPPGTNNDRTRISRFRVSTGNANVADPNSELVLMEFEQPWPNHNAGDMHFGPDGYLYIASGDGGGSYWSSTGQAPRAQYGQDPLDLLGKMIRIDVDLSAGSPPPLDEGPDCDVSGNTAARYRIPPGNAFTDGPGGLGCDEIWSSGLRNPWRFGFDRSTGDAWIADVGQSDWEEVDHVPAGSGTGWNFGWSCFEGNGHPTNNAWFDNDACLPASAYNAPVYEYGHAGGDCSITGGFVYRSPSYLDLAGSYFHSDYCRPSIRTLSGSIGNLTSTEVLPQSQFASPSTFGENAIGDLYVANLNAGTVHRINGTNPRPTSAIVRKAATAPVIDGAVDAVWASADEYSMNNNIVRGSGVWFHKDLWATYRALYDQNNLYFLVLVQDDLLVTDSSAWYDDDDVEIMIDGDRSGGTSYDGNNDYEFGFRWNDPNITPGVNSAPIPAGSQFALVSTGQGYAVEILLPLAAMDIAATSGSTFGLDVHVNDDDDGGARDLKLTWHGTTDDAWRYPNLLSVATLDDGVAGACGQQKILFVGATNPLGAQDQALVNRLTAAGYAVTVRSETAAATGDAYGKSAVLISDSVTSGNVNTKFRNVPVPVIAWEPALFDDLQMTGLTDGIHYGNLASQTQIVIANAGHPLAAGLSGTVTATSSAQAYFWGVPAASADVVATLVGYPGRAGIFAYEPGDLMMGLVAPARRAGFYNGSGQNLTADGAALFDAMVKWAAECGSVSSFTLVDAATGQAIQPLANGDVVNLGTLPTRNLDVRANVDPATVGSVGFTYDGSESTDNSAPYRLDNPALVHLEWTPGVGSHTLAARPYSGPNRGVRAGQPSTISFQVIDQPLAVSLANFQATAGSSGAVVAWETAAELGNTGFNLYRTGSVEERPDQADRLAFVPSQAPGSAQGASYTFHDPAGGGQAAWYWLEDVPAAGAGMLHGPVPVAPQAPTAVTLAAYSASGLPASVWLAAVAGLFFAAFMVAVVAPRTKN